MNIDRFGGQVAAKAAAQLASLVRQADVPAEDETDTLRELMKATGLLSDPQSTDYPRGETFDTSRERLTEAVEDYRQAKEREGVE